MIMYLKPQKNGGTDEASATGNDGHGNKNSTEPSSSDSGYFVTPIMDLLGLDIPGIPKFISLR